MDRGGPGGWSTWPRWVRGNHPGEAMQRAEGPYAKAQRLVLYYRHLFCEGKRGEQITAASSALRYHLGVRGVNTDFFDSTLAVVGRKSGKRSVEEKRTREESIKRTGILPLGLEAVVQMRGELWSASDWSSARGLDQRALWIAIGLGDGRRGVQPFPPDVQGLPGVESHAPLLLL
jgi:hypothetical protein